MYGYERAEAICDSEQRGMEPFGFVLDDEMFNAVISVYCVFLMEKLAEMPTEEPMAQHWRSVLAQAPSLTSPEQPDGVYDLGQQEVQELFNKGIVSEGDSILDIGCGIGRLAVHLAQRNVTYVGIDPIRKCIEFAHESFADYPNCSFHHIDLQNSFYNLSGTDPALLRLPLKDASFDAVLAVSLFTHFESSAECQRYVREVHRVLRERGSFYSTWFRAPPNHPNWDGYRTVILESEILNFFSGFQFAETWGGNTKDYHDQWRIHAKKVSGFSAKILQRMRAMRSFFIFREYLE
ncbi:hypothetical protein COU78_01850 [Candidatus Peregrinibacteria bacterium CG10_big_fil_rev_8_21_14_0_10_49_24]|nr:MAG: hypothetical protein COV83_05960 [Candidatus Peregrinibacteria bacterium CG11_big_fil_rev_8_21_14_0_20_49_14]PIR51311.1 MAG: hypothetical protein COU78_01850 [Candidatus Peregrinibacteria bacterium CG10_big_fil_rev_8_21_14_0_10_49_24]PJA67416.1 MAG: hypothetical protein CO157_04700 [Candidatus Peregrinibacteria bacterium CG_4_9_14_3_um_filter_49_12]